MTILSTLTLKTDDSSFQFLKNKILEKKAKIGILGLGYVGLPLLKTFCEKGYETIGFDIDTSKIDALKEKKSYIRHIPHEGIAKIVDSGRFTATTDFSRADEADVLIMCVPTPLTIHRDPDMSYIVSTAGSVAPYIREGHLVILESTTYPGTLKEVVQPIIEKAGFIAGENYFLAYSPEREDPGNPNFETSTIPKVVGADDDGSLELSRILYEQAVCKVVSVSSSATAEAVKLTENIFRSVNIALVNELKVIFDKMNIDVWEVIEAAKSKPFGFMPFYPGPGLGGHCIPIDPFYLTWKAREYGVTTRFIELAGQINTHMPDYVIHKLLEALDQKFARGLNQSKILVLGIAYKKNIDDMRESPSLILLEKLEKHGAHVDYYDPFIPEIPMTREHAHLAGKKSVKFDGNHLSSYDAVLICTDHDDIDYEAIVTHSKLVVDSRNATQHVKHDRHKIVKA
ncbi:MAG: nucleotide sugar dehydrogenase [Alphaproteobacteria bacterium]|nr:nucleotide sugar dehydrogenase [Alphaproteobacteria bacterium]